MKIAIPLHMGDNTFKLNNAYVNFVSGAGMEPVLFTKLNDIKEIAASCDGLLLPGGVDIEPTFYGDNNVASNNCNPERDDFERKSLRAFMDEGKKVFGICRGFQLIVREFLLAQAALCKGLTFFQHINEHALTRARNAKRSTPTHDVMTNFNALYGSVDTKNGSMFINSIHHQALIARGQKVLDIAINKHNKLHCLAITKFGAPSEGGKDALVVEAVDIVLEGIALRGVQWHPEELMDTALLTTFFNEAKNGSKKSAAKL